MSAVLEVSRLTKEYPKFLLDDVSFSMEEGSIMGFIGRNGAGKTTTLKSILNLVHPDEGTVRFFGLDLAEHEREIRQRIGYAGGALAFYQKKKISKIVEVSSAFYSNWDDELYRKYLRVFAIDEDKTPAELSEGMKVKLNLVLALSHRAKLLILDEPTSGLDPVSRDELIEEFLYLKKQGVSILFSSHITSDLEKCADAITYIREGRIVASEPLADFVVFRRHIGLGNNLEEIMIHYEKEALRERLAE